MRRLLLSLVVLCLLLVVTGVGIIGFSEETVTLVINGTEMSFSSPAYKTEDGEVLLPMREFFTLLGVQVHWDDDHNEIISFKNNVFTKLTINSNTAYKNGKAFALHTPPALIDEVSYIPAEFISKAYNMSYEFNQEDRVLTIDYREPISQYSSYAARYFRRIDETRLGLSLEVPSHWDKLQGSGYYGYLSDYERFIMHIEKSQANALLSEADLIKEKVLALSKIYKDDFVLTKNESLYVNGFIGHTLVYTKVSSEPTQQQADGEEELYNVHFIFRVNDDLYELAFTSLNYQSAYALDVIDTIIKTIQVSAFTIDEEREHYVEFHGFHFYDMTLNEEIYSNMRMRSFLPFSGEISREVQKLIVTVERNGQQYINEIPVVEGQFSGKIYSPFGLGKHNVSIRIPGEEGDQDALVSLAKSSDLLLKFSMVNISTNQNLYTMPSLMIPSEHQSIKSQTLYLTYRSLTNMEKAKEVFRYMLLNYELTEETTNPTSAYEALAGDEASLAHLYAAMLRAASIPTKVAKGSIDEGVHYWVEFEINGEWLIADPASALATATSDQRESMIPYFFNLDKEIYYNNYESIEIMNY